MEINKEEPQIKNMSTDFKRNLLNFFDKRSTQYGSNMILLIVAVLGILILVNYIARKEVTRIDLTKNKQYSLSDQSKKILNQVKDEVIVTAFYTESNGARQDLKDLLKEYSSINPKIKLEFIDPEKKPAEAKKYGVTHDGSIFLERGSVKEEANSATESDLTSGLLKIVKNERKKIYFLTGHGEKEITGSDTKKSYAIVKNELEKQIYEVLTLNLITDQKIPDDATVIITAGPSVPLADQELKLLASYVKDKKGKLLIMLDPKVETGKDIKMGEFLKEYGLAFQDGLVIDSEKSFWGDIATPVITDFTNHQITQEQKLAFFNGVANAYQAEKVPENYEVTELAKSSATSWLEMNAEQKEVKYDKDKDKMGPIAVMSLAKGVVPTDQASQDGQVAQNNDNSRIVLIGDSDFALDSFLSTDQGLFNRDLFINTVNWLAAEEELISILPKEEAKAEITLAGRQSYYIFYGTVLAMPILVAVVGIAVFIKRKKKTKRS